MAVDGGQDRPASGPHTAARTSTPAAGPQHDGQDHPVAGPQHDGQDLHARLGGSARKPLSLWPGMYHSPVTNAPWEARSSIFERKMDAGGNSEAGPQTELLTKTPAQSQTTIVYKFATDDILREKYRDPWNEVRIGKLLEDLDALAGTIAVKDCVSLVTTSSLVAPSPSSPFDAGLSRALPWQSTAARTAPPQAPSMAADHTATKPDQDHPPATPSATASETPPPRALPSSAPHALPVVPLSVQTKLLHHGSMAIA
ncbi:hypothetical protein ZWY2020_014348 [Hordeum vulgare]|nr:hypothetical protein ZWY2020_014348 [Hordeum vulgare]